MRNIIGSFALLTFFYCANIFIIDFIKKYENKECDEECDEECHEECDEECDKWSIRCNSEYKDDEYKDDHYQDDHDEYLGQTAFSVLDDNKEDKTEQINKIIQYKENLISLNNKLIELKNKLDKILEKIKSP